MRADMGLDVETIGGRESRSLSGFPKLCRGPRGLRPVVFSLRPKGSERNAGRWRGGYRPPAFETKKQTMKILSKVQNGERREALLREYFLTASLIALLKRAGEEAVKAVTVVKPLPLPLPVRVRR